MTTPTAVLNARERLVKSILHWVRVVNDDQPAGGPQIAAAVAADMFGDPLPDIAPVPGKPTSAHIGPIGQLAMWFALYCEESGILLPGETRPAGILVNPNLLTPLLALHPQTFEADIYHKLDTTFDKGHTICATCKLGVQAHYETLDQAQVAEIESLAGDIEIMEATMDIQMQAITKGTEAIEGLQAKIEALTAGYMEADIPYTRAIADGLLLQGKDETPTKD